MTKNVATQFCFILLALLCLFPFTSSAVALVAGILFAVLIGNPFLKTTQGWTSRLLQISVVSLGAGMDLNAVFHVGKSGVLYTVIGIGLTLGVGYLFGRLLKVRTMTSLLISCGTAICGGSAIAAVASVLGAPEEDVSVSLVTVFLLNSAALLLFPVLGHELRLSQTQFGYWSALAIHDTSSVVGASMQYGAEALQLATVIKLTRALWIVPLALGLGMLGLETKNSGRKKAKRPWFILGFLLAAALVTYVPGLHDTGLWVQAAAKRSLVLTLFLIGSAVPKNVIKDHGSKLALIQGVALWLVVGSATLGAIQIGWIR